MGGSTTQTAVSTQTTTNTSTLGNQGDGTTNTNSELVAANLQGATASTISFVSQSPEALALAGQSITQSLGLAEAATQSALGFASQQAAQANQLAGASTNTFTAVTPILKWGGLILVVGLGIYMYFKKG